MRNFVCPNCTNVILHEFVPQKKWFVFGTREGSASVDECGIHEVIKEFDSQDEAIEYITNTPSLHEARFVSDDVQK